MALKKSIYSERYQLFLNLLVDARKRAKMTQVQLAEELEKPQSFVAKYENNERRLDVAEFVIIAKAIGVDPVKIVKKLK